MSDLPSLESFKAESEAENGSLGCQPEATLPTRTVLGQRQTLCSGPGHCASVASYTPSLLQVALQPDPPAESDAYLAPSGLLHGHRLSGYPRPPGPLTRHRLCLNEHRLGQYLHGGWLGVSVSKGECFPVLCRNERQQLLGLRGWEAGQDKYPVPLPAWATVTGVACSAATSKIWVFDSASEPLGGASVCSSVRRVSKVCGMTLTRATCCVRQGALQALPLAGSPLGRTRLFSATLGLCSGGAVASATFGSAREESATLGSARLHSELDAADAPPWCRSDSSLLRAVFRD